MFVEESRELWSAEALDGQGTSRLTRTATTWDRAIAANPQEVRDVNLVGILRGDVDGSWVAPASMPDLDLTDPTYFQDLASLIGVLGSYCG